jgi:kumamolisin
MRSRYSVLRYFLLLLLVQLTFVACQSAGQSTTSASTSSSQATCASITTGSSGLDPHQVATAYGFDQLYQHGWTGKGLTIILPEFSGYLPTDIQHYFSCVGYRGKFSTITVNNEPPSYTTGEPTLDIEMVAGLAPDANIVVYQMNEHKENGDLPTIQPLSAVLHQIIQDNQHNQSLKVLSISSWGRSELTLTPGAIAPLHEALQTLVQQEHITVCSVSGDRSSYETRQYPTSLSVLFPASDPWVVSAGGTVLTVLSSGQRASRDCLGQFYPEQYHLSQ